MVEGFVKLRELGNFSHHILVHEEWWDHWSVPMLSKELDSVVLQRLVEQDTRACEVVPTMTSDLGPSDWIESSDSPQ